MCLPTASLTASLSFVGAREYGGGGELFGNRCEAEVGFGRVFTACLDVGGALDLGLEGFAIAENEERGAGIDEGEEKNEHGA